MTVGSGVTEIIDHNKRILWGTDSPTLYIIYDICLAKLCTSNRM